MRRITFVLLTTLLFFAALADAQTFRGAINGTVTDPSGAFVPGATVKATDKATGVVHSTVSTTEGQFAFQDLPLGLYTVNVSSSGFSPVTVDNVAVSAGSIYTLPVKLKVGQESVSVEVSAAALALDTTTQAQTTTIESKVVQDVPLNGRDYTQLVAVAPGYGGYSVGGFGSLNGTRPNQINWQIDGVDNNDFWHNIPAVNQGGVSGIAGVVLPVDSIEEFSAQTQSGAEAGRNAGGLVNLVTKSGTNTFHGSAYHFNRNEYYSAASPFFIPSATVPKAPPLRNLHYGGSLNGPIFKNRTFFAISFEKQQYIIGLSGLATEPSDAWINKALGVLSTFGVAPSPLSTKLIGSGGFWPRNLIGSLPATTNNFFSPVASTGYSYNGTIKLDHNLTDKHHLSARWFGGQGSQTAPLGGSPALGTASSNLKDYFEVAPIHVQNYHVIMNSTLSSRLANQVLFGVNYFNQVFHDFNNSFDTRAMGLFLSPDAKVNGKPIAGAPNIAISGFEQIGLTPPEGRNDITAHLTDIVSYTIGKHQFRFGGEIRQGRVDEFYYRRGTGKFTFDGKQGPWSGNANLDTPTKALADFMSGKVASSGIAVGNAEREVKVNAFNLYFQDAFQLTPRLNLNYGLRYEYFGPLHNDEKNLAVFVPGKGLLVQGNGLDSIFHQDRNNFAPRFGFAYQPTASNNLVVRGGLTVNYDQINMNPFLDFRPPIPAASGLQGNPGGPTPYSTYSKNLAGQSSYTWQLNQQIFPGVFSCPDPQCSTAVQGTNLFAVSQDFRTPYFYTYNLQVERSLGNAAILQVGYVGNNGRKLNIVSNLNQDSTFGKFGSILQLNSIGTSNYNGLQTTFRLRSWHGFGSTFSYTWSHALDEISEYRAVISDDIHNLKLDYGNGDYDTRHLFTTTFTYDIPGASWGPKLLTQGWALAGVFNFHTGQPYDEVFSGLSLVGKPFSGLSHDFSAANGGTLWINPTAFCDANTPPCPTGPVVAGNALGNVRRNTFYGPGYGSADLSVIKNISLYRENRVKAQLRADMFNIFNRINLASGPGSVTTGGCAQDPATNRCATPSSKSYSGFGLVSDTIGDFNGAPGIGPGEPFNMQLAIKIIF